jgi:hypothetical protein
MAKASWTVRAEDSIGRPRFLSDTTVPRGLGHRHMHRRANQSRDDLGNGALDLSVRGEGKEQRQKGTNN